MFCRRAVYCSFYSYLFNINWGSGYPREKRTFPITRNFVDAAKDCFSGQSNYKHLLPIFSRQTLRNSVHIFITRTFLLVLTCHLYLIRFIYLRICDRLRSGALGLSTILSRASTSTQLHHIRLRLLCSFRISGIEARHLSFAHCSEFLDAAIQYGIVCHITKSSCASYRINSFDQG